MDTSTSRFFNKKSIHPKYKYMYMYNRMTLLRSIALLILHVVILSNFCTAFVIRSSSALHYYNSYKYSHSHYRKREQLVCHKYKVHFCRHVYQRNVLYLSKEKDDENEVSSFSIDLEEGDMFGPLLPLAQKINNGKKIRFNSPSPIFIIHSLFQFQ